MRAVCRRCEVFSRLGNYCLESLVPRFSTRDNLISSIVNLVVLSRRFPCPHRTSRPAFDSSLNLQSVFCCLHFLLLSCLPRNIQTQLWLRLVCFCGSSRRQLQPLKVGPIKLIHLAGPVLQVKSVEVLYSLCVGY